MADVTHRVRVASIADHLHLVETIATWHWDEWGRPDLGGSLTSWMEGMHERTSRGRIPTTYAALDGDELLGAVTLVQHDMSTHPELAPWLAGLYVAPDARGRGIGSALTYHAVREAATMGAGRLYLYTASARGFYQRLGWQPIGEEWYLDEAVTIMAIGTNGGDGVLG